MEKVDFWRLIESAKVAGGADCEGQTEALVTRLERLPADEIVAFDQIFSTLHAEAFRWDLWGAAYVINGGCSDDGFFYFRSWLIGQGRSVYENALDDPETLADSDVEPEEAECEELGYAAARAYEAKTGTKLPTADRANDPQEPFGQQWDEDDLESLFPLLYDRYGTEPD